MCKVYKVKFQLLDSIHVYYFANQRDIVQDISFRLVHFELKLLSSNNLVIKHLPAISSVGLSQVFCYVFICACLFLSFVYLHSAILSVVPTVLHSEQRLSLDSISLEIVNRQTLSYVLVQVTANAPLLWVKLILMTDNP